uniref:Putative tick til 3 n=1 Tax=Amblyomma parvum TaxID=251391 RepID=A0A023G101_AMBPA
MAKLASIGLLALLSVLWVLFLQVTAQQGSGAAFAPAGGKEVDRPYSRPFTLGCPPGETLLRCRRRVCCEWKCGASGLRRACPIRVFIGCFCKPGYHRNRRNKCVAGLRCKRLPWNPYDYEYLTPKRRLGYAGF